MFFFLAQRLLNCSQSGSLGCIQIVLGQLGGFPRHKELKKDMISNGNKGIWAGQRDENEEHT